MASALFAFLAVPALLWQNHRPVQLMSISQWKSPTGFLIETPGQKLFNTVPHIGDGFMDMRALNAEEKR